MTLSTLGICLILYKTLVILILEEGFHNNKCCITESLFFAIPFCNIFEGNNFLLVAAYKNCKEYFICFGLLLSILNLTQQSIFICLLREELERKRSTNLFKTLIKARISSITKANDLIRVKVIT